MSERYPIAPFPEGWYRVAWSDELRTRDVVPLEWLGRHLVLYRGDSGRAHVLDAHCPHLGAHLGHGGRVHGETIECPFHGWRMSCAGSCVLVPLSKKVPPRAKVRSWPVVEVSGAVLVYWHPEGEAPRWTPAPIAAWNDPQWTRPARLGPWRVRTHVQEFGENGVDLGHAVMLHSAVSRAAETLDTQSDGPVFRHKSRHHYRVFEPLEWLGKRVVGTLDTSIDGFGRVSVHAHVDAGIPIEYSVTFYPTPIDDEWVELTGALTVRKHSSRIVTHLLFAKSVREAKRTIDEDLPIWTNKRYQERPLLVEGEQAMGQYRRWARQFYPPEADALRAAGT